MPEMNAIRPALKQKRGMQADKERALSALRGQLRRLDEEVQQLKREGVRVENDARNTSERHTFQLYESTKAELLTAAASLKEIRQTVAELGAGRGQVPSSEAIRLFADTRPLLLFPVRIETKFIRDTQPPQLWVRIYPDDIAVETHESLLTEEEFDGAAQYYRDVWPALVDPLAENALEIQKGAWRRLVDTYGAPRSAWILRVSEEEAFVLNLVVEEIGGAPQYRVAERTPLFAVAFDAAFQADLDSNTIPETWAEEFEAAGFPLSGREQLWMAPGHEQWQITDTVAAQIYRVVREAEQHIVSVIGPPRFKVTKETLLFTDLLAPESVSDLDNANAANVCASWAQHFKDAGFALSDNLDDLWIQVVADGERWEIEDAKARQTYGVIKDEEKLVVWALPLPVRPESWSEAPRSHVLPDRFAVRLYRGNMLVHEAEGAPVPHPLIVGPAPFPLEEADNGDSADTQEEATDAFFDADSAWIADFDKAVEVGTGLRIDLTQPEDLTQGFSRVIILGIKASADPEESATYLRDLIESHRYTEGFAFVRQGTPTNNTSEAQAGYSSQESSDESFELVHGALTLEPHADGPRFASALGVPEDLFKRTYGADGTENRNAERMLEALWSATWGYYFDAMLGGVLPPDDVARVRQHLIAHVRGRGPFSAIRVGNLPYGSLPVFGLLGQEPPDEIDSAETFDRRLRWFLLKLLPRWRSMADSVEAVPRAGGSNDPEQELIRILGMEGTGRHVHVRSIITEFYLWHLLRFMQPTLFHPGVPSFFTDESGAQFRSWWESFEAAMDKSGLLYREFAPDAASLPEIIKTVPWNPAQPFDGPLVTEDPLSEEHPLEGPPGAEPARPNYIRWLSEQTMGTIRDDDEAGTQGSALLFQLLRRSILLEESESDDDHQPSRVWLDHLAALPTGELERLLVGESLDLACHRLDAWIVSLASKQLMEIRGNGSEGIQLGAFGWVEDLKPAVEPQGGYIHAPSISHAATAAVLRSAYLTHADRGNANVMAVNLTSERVRRSLWLLDGIREGQELGALLGYRFERGLHDRSGGPEGVELDKHVSVFRNLYPMKVVVRERDEQSPEEAAESIAARNVVDGLRLLDARGDIPFGQYGLPTAGPEYEAIQRELDAIDDSLDALGDLALAESVYQSVQGNYPRAGALLEAISGNGRPPEPEVVQTPRSGINLKHRLLMLFTGAPIQHNWPQTPRGVAEPYLTGWAAQLFGEPDHIKCTLRFPPTDATDEGAAEQRIAVSLRDLGVGPLDFLYLAQSPAAGEATELEQRVAYQAGRAWAHVVLPLQGRAAAGQASIPVLDNASSYQGGTLRIFSWPHTVGSDESAILIVGVCLNRNGAAVEAITFGGQELEKVEQQRVDGAAVELWYLMAPTSGTSDIVVTLDRSEPAVAGAASFVHVDQETPFSGAAKGSARGLSISTQAPAAAGAILLDAWVKVGPLGHPLPAADQTRVWSRRTNTAAEADDNVQGGMSYASPADTQEMHWTFPLRIEFSHTDVLGNDDLPIADVLPLARKMLEIVGNARPLGPLDLQLPEEAVSPDETDESAEALEQRAGEQAPLYDVLRQRLTTGDPQAPGALELITSVHEALDSATADEECRDAIFAAAFFGIQGAIPVDVAGKELKAQGESVKRQISRRVEDCRKALDAADAVFDGSYLARTAAATAHLIAAFHFLFGRGFPVLPRFAPTNRDELRQALDEQNTADLLDGENASWPVLWLQQLASVHPDIARFESVLMLAEALSGEVHLALRVAQLPHGASNRWLALPYRGPNETPIRQGTLSLVAYVPGAFEPATAYAGIVLGDRDEIIPGSTETTAVAFRFNRPNAEPPNVLLLPVLLESKNDQHTWSWDALVNCVESALELAKVRGVDLDAMKEFGRLLPALYAPIRVEERDSA